MWYAFFQDVSSNSEAILKKYFLVNCINCSHVQLVVWPLSQKPSVSKGLINGYSEGIYLHVN